MFLTKPSDEELTLSGSYEEICLALKMCGLTVMTDVMEVDDEVEISVDEDGSFYIDE